jgi:CARDB
MKRQVLLSILPVVVFLGAASAVAACDGGSDASGPGGGGTGATAGAGGTAGDGGSFTVGSGGASVECTTPCEQGQICSHGVCIPGQACSTDDDCDNDTYCEDGQCAPWEQATPQHDPTCVYVTAAGILSPRVRCEFAKAPDGDAFPAHVDVQGTPIVVNFNGFQTVPDSDPVPIGTPSIAASFTATVPGGYTENLGVLRVLSGADCSLEANLTGADLDGDGVIDWSYSAASLAAGDLDGDGKAEIVAYGIDQGQTTLSTTLAFTFKEGAWKLLWKAKDQNGSTHISPILGGWAGPSIHDLDDDGVPEILREGQVFSSTGTLLAPSPAGYASYSQGLFPVLANLDSDPQIEMTNGQLVWQWNNGAWEQDPTFPGATPSAPGHVAVADFGAYGQVPPERPELAVVRDNFAMVYAMTGELAMAPIAVPGGGGGPPTVADFDGDGLPELAVAGKAYYTIYDIDCTATPRAGGVCPPGSCDFGACPPGIAWSKSTQDDSSNITGSSVFDFEADGEAEVVYADECFVRVYKGTTGEVIFSQYRSSCTWYENPVIADVDGNYRADLVVPSNRACSPTGDGIPCKYLTPEGVDSQFAGLRCDTDQDCASGTCDQGLCRCTTSADCCADQDDAKCVELGYQCATPPAGTPGAGNTCRAGHPHGVSGIRVYADANDKWVRSRMIWNQHAYAVTHVNEDGTIPKSSAWQNNWQDPALNNFRTNVPGQAGGADAPDTTAGASSGYTCDDNTATLTAPVCNRGAAPVGAGVKVGFYANGALVCTAETKTALFPDDCETVTCDWAGAPTTQSGAVDVTVKANDGAAVSECKSGNNDGIVLDVYCKPTG